jgi:hypothetical protein
MLLGVDEMKGEEAIRFPIRDCKHKGLPKFGPSKGGKDLLMFICIDLIGRRRQRCRLRDCGGGYCDDCLELISTVEDWPT